MCKTSEVERQQRMHIDAGPWDRTRKENIRGCNGTLGDAAMQGFGGAVRQRRNSPTWIVIAVDEAGLTGPRRRRGEGGDSSTMPYRWAHGRWHIHRLRARDRFRLR
jgi:hypothetical protein